MPRSVMIVLSDQKMNNREFSNSLGPWADEYTMEDLSEEFKETIGEKTATYSKFGSGFIKRHIDVEFEYLTCNPTRYGMKRFVKGGWVKEKIDIEKLDVELLIDLDDKRNVSHIIDDGWNETLTVLMQHHYRDDRYVYHVTFKYN